MTKPSIKILDCTLRDGGYLVDWDFGQDRIESILNNLTESGVDFIECGFLKELNYSSDKTFFDLISRIEKYVKPVQNYTLMVNFGEYNINHFSKCVNKNIKIRVAFRKNTQKYALGYIEQLKYLGWDVFANPMSTNTYSQEELSTLISELNEIKPFGVSIVDTLGNMYENEVINIFKFIDKNLDPEIAIGVHFHNSMQLAFSNTKAVLKANKNRTLIIDSCLYGMGRGAGNLCTELITKYLNDNYEGKYKISPILNSIEIDLKPIYQKNSRGYSTPFYIAALHGCHPNYAGFLVKEQCSDAQIDLILSQIPKDKRTTFDSILISDLLKKIILNNSPCGYCSEVSNNV